MQYRVRDCCKSLIPKSTHHEIRIAAGEVAQYFTALSSCDKDTLDFLTKKIKTYLKAQRKKLKKKNGTGPLPTENWENEIEAVSAETDYDQVDEKNSVENVSPRKRVLSSDHYDFDENEDTPVLNSVKRPPGKSKKAKVCRVSEITQAKNEDVPEMTRKEFSSQNSRDIKFEIGHFVVLGKDIDAYEFCRIDNVEYHKLSGKYHMSITYYHLIDGRLEVLHKKGNGNKPLTQTRVPLNTVILNLRHTRLVDTDMKNEIIKITRDLYS